jgi:ribosomal protein L37AE/L43A
MLSPTIYHKEPCPDCGKHSVELIRSGLPNGISRWLCRKCGWTQRIAIWELSHGR